MNYHTYIHHANQPEIKYFFKDVYFKNERSHKLRRSVRVLVRNKDNEIALLRIKGRDIFGYRNHYESLGGGVKNFEPDTAACKREAYEEAGLLITNLKFICRVVDEYALISQTNVQDYYIADIIKIKKPSEKLEGLSRELVFNSIQAWIQILSRPYHGVNALVHQRELYLMTKLKNL